MIGTEPNQREWSKSLQTLLLNRFHLKGGLNAILGVINSLNENFPPADKDATAVETERRLAISANLKRGFHLIRIFTTESLINESPQSAYLTNRDRHKDSGHYFSISAFLTDTRASCLPVLTNMLSLLNKLDKAIAQPLLSTLSDLILGGPEEFHTEQNKPEAEPTEDVIQRICLHGFDRGQAYAALMTHNNVETAALNYLLSRRTGTNSPLPLLPFPGDYSPEMPEMVESPPAQIANPAETEQNVAPLLPETLVPSADTRMDIDTPNPEPASTEKGKAKEVTETRIETLTRLRAEFSANLENYITDILVYHPDLPFDLARLIKSVGKWEAAEFRQEKMLELAARLASLEDDKATKAKEIAACAHVLGLLLTEPRYYTSAEAGIVEFLDSFVGFLTIEEGMETPWIASVAFIIEVVIREVEWRQCKKKQDPTHAPLEVAEIEPEFYARLLEKLVDVLKSDLTDENVIISVLRLLVRLTREGKYARIFRERNGIQSLLQLNHKHAGKNTLKISDPSLIIIRHVVEDDKIVLATMRSVIQNVLDMGANRGRHVDLNELLRNKNPEVLRNPELFSHAVEQLAKLSYGWSSAHPNNHKLTKKQTEPPAAANAEATKPEGETETKESKPVPPETPKKSTLELSYSTGVVQTLLTELLNHHSDTEISPKKDVVPVAGTNGASPEGEATAVANAPRTKLTPEECKEYAYTLFLLQAIAELVGSYNNCKLEFVNYSRRGQSRDPQTPSKPRSMMLNYLLNDLLPTGSVSSQLNPNQDMDFEKKRGISMLVANVIQSLCKKTPEFYEHDERPDLLVTVRKFVLEGIARSFKEILATTGPTQLRYSRYTHLAELCRKLLTTQSPYSAPTFPLDSAGTSEMAKLMFEKGFISLLTTVVADIELDFPDVRSVINDILASLKDLTAYVNRLASNSTIELGNTSGDMDEISTASSVSEEAEEMQDRDETPDVFRNSALGMLQGVVEDNGHNHHHHLHHHLGYHDYDEVMDYDEEDEDDDDEDDDLDESGSEDEEMDEDGEDDMNVRINICSR
jgi:E3 ubiquitin-protein ligase HUWE1